MSTSAFPRAGSSPSVADGCVRSGLGAGLVSIPRVAGLPALGDIGLEGSTVDRAIQNPRGNEATERERADEGRGFPVPMGNTDTEPFTPQAPAMAARHVGRGPGLVDEDHVGIKIGLGVEPVLPPLRMSGDLLACVRRL